MFGLTAKHKRGFDEGKDCFWYQHVWTTQDDMQLLVCLPQAPEQHKMAETNEIFVEFPLAKMAFCCIQGDCKIECGPTVIQAHHIPHIAFSIAANPLYFTSGRGCQSSKTTLVMVMLQ